MQLWSTLPFGNWSGSLLKEHMEMPRSVYSHDDYVYLVGHGEVRNSMQKKSDTIQPVIKLCNLIKCIV